MRLLSVLLLLLASVSVGCAAKPEVADFGEGDDPYDLGVSADELSRSGRWMMPADVQAAGDAQRGTYTSAGAWNGGRSCSGGLKSGTRMLGDYIIATIGGASSYDGYACRPNTANTSELSMHGTGRALDVFVPMAGGRADNDRGDRIANWLVTHATEIGVQFIIWDQTKWNISYSGRKDKSYTGPNPHIDHLHVELTPAGARGETPWFTGPAEDPMEDPVTPPPDPAPAPTMVCTDTCRWHGDGECDDGGPGSLYSVCEFGTDCADCGPRGTGGSTPPPEPTPPPAPPPATDGWVGLDLDGMAIPRRGLDNPTLRGALGISTEPLGDVTTFEGHSFVRGTLSWFGGPTDTGVSSTETGAVTGERLRSLHNPVNPTATDLASRPQDFYFVAMRWKYAPQGVTWLRTARVLVVNPATGARVVVRPVDWGPNTRTGRIIDLSLQSLRDLGVDTDDTVLVSWAAPGTPLGRVR